MRSPSQRSERRLSHGATNAPRPDHPSLSNGGLLALVPGCVHTFWQRQAVPEPVRRRATVAVARAGPRRPPVLDAAPVIRRRPINVLAAAPLVPALRPDIARLPPAFPRPVAVPIAVPAVVPLPRAAVLAVLALPAASLSSAAADPPPVQLAAAVAVRALAAVLAPPLRLALRVPVAVLAVALAALLGGRAPLRRNTPQHGQRTAKRVEMAIYLRDQRQH